MRTVATVRLAVSVQTLWRAFFQKNCMRQALQKDLSKSCLQSGWITPQLRSSTLAGVMQKLSIAPVVDYQMQFEAVKPAHRAFANGSNIFENPVSLYAFIFANCHFCGVNESNSRAFSETNQFEKKCEMEHYFALKFNKTIVKQKVVEFVLQMFVNIKEIKMFQIPETAIVKTNHNGNNFGIGHRKFAISVAFAVIVPDFVFFSSCSNSLQKSSAIQKISVILSVVSCAIIFVYLVDYQLLR